MRVIDRPSPNHEARQPGQIIDMLLLHYTGMPSAAVALDRMCDPAARVSAHYCIDEDGTVYRLVSEARRAWHAGQSSWGGVTDINGRSIGIELVNPGHDHGYRPFPAPQMAALIALSQAILARHPIPPEHVLGHSDVAPLRKTDPGELFDWAGLARAGIGLWPAPAEGETEAAGIEEIRSLLNDFGYDVGTGDEVGALTRAAIAAFQRHFRPTAVTGEADAETTARLKALLAQRAGPSRSAN